MLIIMIASYFFWGLELDWCYATFHNWLGLLIFFVMMFATPFVLWWAIGIVVFLVVKTLYL